MKRYGKSPRSAPRGPKAPRAGQPAAEPLKSSPRFAWGPLLAGGIIFAAAWAGGRFLGGEKSDVVQPVIPPTPAAPKVVNEVSSGSPMLQLRLLPEGLDRRQRLMALIGTAGTADLPGLLRDARGDRFAETALIERWTEMDPSGCLVVLRSGQYDMSNQDYLLGETLFKRWALKDAAAALAAAKSCAMIPGFRNAAWNVISSVLASDFTKAGELIAQMPNPPRGFSFPESLWKVDPGELVKAALSGGAPDARMKTALTPVLEAWSDKDPDGALNWLRSQPPEMLAGVLAGCMKGIGPKDPQGAAELIRRLSSAADRDAAGLALARAWNPLDGAAAFSWAFQNLSGKRAEAMEAIAKNCVEAGSDFAKKSAASLPPGALRDQVITVLAKTWLDIDPSNAGPWISSLPADQTRADITRQLAVRWAENDPASGRAFLLSNFQTPEGGEFLRLFMSRHAQYEPLVCLEMAKQLPPAQNSEVVQTVFNATMMQYDFKTATSLLGSLPSAEKQVEAVTASAQAFASGFLTVSDGIEWFKSLPAGVLRNTAREIFQQSTEITEEDKSAMLQALQ